MTGLHVFHAHNGDNVARGGERQLITLVGLHLDHPAHTLGFAGEGVEDGVAFVQLA